MNVAYGMLTMPCVKIMGIIENSLRFYYFVRKRIERLQTD